MPATKPGTRAHENGRYVKSAWIGLAAFLACASPAPAEVVTGAADRGVLAVAADESPRVAYAVGRDLYVARRAGAGWRSTRVARLPGAGVLAGIAVESRAVVSVLAQDAGGKWIVLARGNRLLRIARARGANTYGAAGLTVDGHGRSAVAYAVRLASGATYLRLVTIDARGRLRTRGITLRGFPASEAPPSAVPVLVGGRLHVVEAYNAAAIDWGPKGKTWEGQYLFAGRFGSVVGPVAAVASQGTLYSALTLDLPQFGESNVVSLASRTTQESAVVFPHALLAALVVPVTGPEVAANDFVATDAGSVFAALVAAPGLAVQVDGRIDGYAAVEEGSRYLLLAHPTGLEFFAVPALLPVEVRLESAAGADGAARLSGSVTGAGSGEVEIYRETSRRRAPAGRVSLASDGSFTFVDPVPESGTFYRAVYREPTTGLPYAALLRSSCCATRRG